MDIVALANQAAEKMAGHAKLLTRLSATNGAFDLGRFIVTTEDAQAVRDALLSRDDVKTLSMATTDLAALPKNAFKLILEGIRNSPSPLRRLVFNSTNLDQSRLEKLGHAMADRRRLAGKSSIRKLNIKDNCNVLGGRQELPPIFDNLLSPGYSDHIDPNTKLVIDCDDPGVVDRARLRQGTMSFPEPQPLAGAQNRNSSTDGTNTIPVAMVTQNSTVAAPLRGQCATMVSNDTAVRRVDTGSPGPPAQKRPLSSLAVGPAVSTNMMMVDDNTAGMGSASSPTVVQMQMGSVDSPTTPVPMDLGIQQVPLLKYVEETREKLHRSRSIPLPFPTAVGDKRQSRITAMRWTDLVVGPLAKALVAVAKDATKKGNTLRAADDAMLNPSWFGVVSDNNTVRVHVDASCPLAKIPDDPARGREETKCIWQHVQRLVCLISLGWATPEAYFDMYTWTPEKMKKELEDRCLFEAADFVAFDGFYNGPRTPDAPESMWNNVANHPLMWDPAQRIKFMQEVGEVCNSMRKASDDPNSANARILQNINSTVGPVDWSAMDPVVLATMNGEYGLIGAHAASPRDASSMEGCELLDHHQLMDWTRPGRQQGPNTKPKSQGCTLSTTEKPLHLGQCKRKGKEAGSAVCNCAEYLHSATSLLIQGRHLLAHASGELKTNFTPDHYEAIKQAAGGTSRSDLYRFLYENADTGNHPAFLAEQCLLIRVYNALRCGALDPSTKQDYQDKFHGVLDDVIPHPFRR